MFFFSTVRDGLFRMALPVAFALLMLILGGWNNQFPFFYHPDEGGKARQAQSGSRNYHHPLLQLNASALAGHLIPGEKDLQHYAVVGRWTAAVFSALTVFCLTWLAVQAGGRIAGFLTGSLLALNPLLIENAHYFKEDPSLTFGFAAFLLAAHMHASLPRPGTLYFLGAATAVCLSSKYIGVLALPLALYWVWRFPVEGRRLDYLKFAGALALLIVIFNFQALSHLPRMFSSIAEEVDKAHNAQSGSLRSVPHSYYLHMWMYRDHSVDLILTVIFLAWMIADFRRVRYVHTLSIVLVLVYFAVISMSPKYADRYYLPIQAIVLFWGATGVIGLSRLVSQWTAPKLRILETVLPLVVAAGICLLQLPGALGVLRGFNQDTRGELVEFIREVLPATAIVAQDKKVKLPNASRPDEYLPSLDVPCQVLPPARYGFVADLGTYPQLLEMGVTHVVVAESEWGALFAKHEVSDVLESETFVQRRQFYEDLFDKALLLRQFNKGGNYYLSPQLRIYQLQ